MQPPPPHTHNISFREEMLRFALILKGWFLITKRPWYPVFRINVLRSVCLFIWGFFLWFFFYWEGWIHLTFKKGSWSHKFTRSDAKQQTNEMNIKPINNLTPALVLSVLSQHYHRRLNTMPPRFEFPSVQWYLNKGDIICIQFSNAQSNRYSCIFFY